jgi:putative ABC transport system permease protein
MLDIASPMRVFASLQQDLRDAVRSLRRSKTVTLAAIATLALGIGATTAIFSLVEAVLFRRLPVASPDRLFFVAHGT